MTSHSPTSFLTKIRASWLRRFVLACFMLAVGVATASPLLKPQSIELLCGAGSTMKLLIKSSDGEAVDSTHSLPCALCAQTSAPPPSVTPPIFRSDLAYATEPTPAAVLAALTQPPLPARGPPVHSFSLQKQ
ncbi:MAG: DUF2946 domain-containing protein [Brachymonas sp.]